MTSAYPVPPAFEDLLSSLPCSTQPPHPPFQQGIWYTLELSSREGSQCENWEAQLFKKKKKTPPSLHEETEVTRAHDS